MRILFLCSCLEPGRDGVGDYTRSLAAECARQGHPSAIIALHDRLITEPVELIASDLEKVPCLRLPAIQTWKQRTGLAAAFRSRFQPDWISLQFVPYGFHDQGLVFNLPRAFRTIISGHRLHLMLHELWIGQTADAPFRQRFIGFLQRLGLKRLISILHPLRVTTSNPAYRSFLQSAGISALLLPLFGNISINPEPELPAELVKLGLAQKREDWWCGIFFGALHPEWKPEPLFSILERAGRRVNKRICLLLAGRPGASGEARWEKLKQSCPSNFVLIKTGEQPAEKISSLLQIADFGIAASPWQLIGKSGTLAAMLDHGLPVIVTRDDFQPRPLPDAPPSTDPLIHRCDDTLEAKLLAGLPKRAPHSRLGDITAEFFRLLEESSPAGSEKTSTFLTP